LSEGRIQTVRARWPCKKYLPGIFSSETIIIYESTYENTLPLKNTAQTTQ
jgi:hypothetical protein